MIIEGSAGEDLANGLLETQEPVPHTIKQAIRQGKDWYAPTMSPTLKVKFNVTPRKSATGRSGWRKKRTLPPMAEALVRAMLEADDAFNVRDYFLRPELIENIRRLLEENGWSLTEKNPSWGWKFGRNIWIDGYPCRLVLTVHPDPNFESYLDAYADYVDKFGHDRYTRIDDRDVWWELREDESFVDYVGRIEQGVKNLRLPMDFEDEASK